MSFIGTSVPLPSHHTGVSYSDLGGRYTCGCFVLQSRNLNLLKELLTSLPNFCSRMGHYLYYLGQQKTTTKQYKTELPTALEAMLGILSSEAV